MRAILNSPLSMRVLQQNVKILPKPNVDRSKKTCLLGKILHTYYFVISNKNSNPYLKLETIDNNQSRPVLKFVMPTLPESSTTNTKSTICQPGQATIKAKNTENKLNNFGNFVQSLETQKIFSPQVQGVGNSLSFVEYL